jgi:hypothetical protein
MGTDQIGETVKKSEIVHWISREKEDTTWMIGRKCQRQGKFFVRRESSNILALRAVGKCSEQNFYWKQRLRESGHFLIKSIVPVFWNARKRYTRHFRVSGWFDNAGVRDNPFVFSRSLSTTKRDYSSLDCRAMYSFSQGDLSINHGRSNLPISCFTSNQFRFWRLAKMRPTWMKGTKLILAGKSFSFIQQEYKTCEMCQLNESAPIMTDFRHLQSRGELSDPVERSRILKWTQRRILSQSNDTSRIPICTSVLSIPSLSPTTHRLELPGIV